jgi:hypothetical protein
MIWRFCISLRESFRSPMKTLPEQLMCR